MKSRFIEADRSFDQLKNQIGEIINNPKNITPPEVNQDKYVDDLTIAERINLKEQLTTIEDRPLPDNYHSRTGHTLKPEDSKVYNQICEINRYAVKNEMKLNTDKTKLLIFNPSKKLILCLIFL